MQIAYTNVARKGLKKMPAKDRAALIAKLDVYAATGEGDVKKLVGSEYYRLRHGHWRVIFEVEDGLLVIRVAHRRDVYKRRRA
ncbi:type II toxin-antitoxin system RelE family toxin [Roseovarius sp. SYSU LYC5161]|jgi:mRNA interferase RelE/StbE|uniref:type II toxin-antitoxin system RelE family toxin n=1 Tax=Roseovarius halophilus (ex Wu et al. 2025) TaxID=3376060 RepID=UPI00399A17A5